MDQQIQQYIQENVMNDNWDNVMPAIGMFAEESIYQLLNFAITQKKINVSKGMMEYLKANSEPDQWVLWRNDMLGTCVIDDVPEVFNAFFDKSEHNDDSIATLVEQSLRSKNFEYAQQILDAEPKMMLSSELLADMVNCIQSVNVLLPYSKPDPNSEALFMACMEPRDDKIADLLLQHQDANPVIKRLQTMVSEGYGVSDTLLWLQQSITSKQEHATLTQKVLAKRQDSIDDTQNPKSKL